MRWDCRHQRIRRNVMTANIKISILKSKQKFRDAKQLLIKNFDARECLISFLEEKFKYFRRDR